MQTNDYRNVYNAQGICKMEKTIAILFIFFFQFKMFSPLQFMGKYTFGLADVSSFVFCVLGLIAILLRGKITFSGDEGTKLLNRFTMMFIICDITSIVMALLLHGEVGTIAGESTYEATLKKILFTFAYILFVFYGYEIWKILSKKEICKVIEYGINTCIGIGIVQLFVLYRFGPAISLYNLINSLFNAWSSELIMKTNRIALLTNEPAYSASYIASFAIPFLLAKMIHYGPQIKDLVKAFLCIVLMYFTKSTTGYVLILVDICVFMLVYFRKGNKDMKKKAGAFICILLITFLLGIIIASNTVIVGNMNNVLDKLLSRDNASSTDRKAIIAVNWEIFKHFPVAGVGNGNQGFFYRAYIPQWMLSSFTVQHDYAQAGSVLFDGGPFWIAFLGGYGLVGVFLLIRFFVNSIRIVNKYRYEAEQLYYFYLLSIFVILVNGIAATMGNTYFMWFVLSFPMALPDIAQNDNKLTCQN